MKVQVNKMFDIDKLNIYWAEDTQNKIFGSLTDEELEDQYSNDEDLQEAMSFEEYKNSYNTSVDRILLNYEKDIILHPRNAHQLLMPLTDEIFVKDIYNDLLKRGVIKAVNSSYFGSMLPSTNVKNTTIFVKGKYGVGPVALAITNAATNQADGLSLNQAYSNQEGIVTPTKLLFDGMDEEYSLDNYTDNKGTVISEILSQLLTTQVDNVKNPTAVLMNINMQTLGVMLYLIRRKINPRTIVLFLQQPIIAKYLQYQRSNESLFNKQADAKSRAKGNKANELSKKWLIKKLLKDLGYGEDMELPDPYVIDEGQDQLVIKDSDMLTSAVEQKFDLKQLEYLSYFIELQSQSRAFSDFQQTQNSDTKGLKDRQMLDESREIVARTFLSQIVDPNDIGRLNFSGVISPFYKYGRLKYSIFNNFYGLSNSVFGGLLLDLKSKAASTLKGDAKDKVRQTIENDFMLFLVHRFMTNKDEFNRLMKGSSVAKRVMDLKTKLPSNLVLQAFFPMINNSLDKSLSKPEKMDNLRLFEKELNDLDNNDMKDSLEEIQEFDSKLYEDIVKLLMFQTGLNISPFNYRSIVPVGLNKNRNEFNEFEYLYQDLLQNAIKEMKKQVRNGKDAEMIFKSFITLFAANNVSFLAKNTNHSNYPFPLIKIWDRESSSWKLKSASNQEQPILGDAYHKQYFESLINPRLESKNKEESKNILNEVFEDHEDVPVTVDAVPNKYELFPGVYANKGQQEALDLLEEFLKSNEKEFTLIGRGGTGKTTIIKKVLSQLNGKSVMGMTVAHKAKKVLGRSIGRDKVKTFASATANKMNETTGKFEPDMYARQQGRVPISSVDVLIVDEASMISPKMRDEINSLIRQGTKVIYMGDNAQLPPVGESEDSPVFNLKNQYTLKEKMRQAKTSPIIGVGSIVADNIEGETKLVAIKDRVSKFDEESKSETVFVSDDNVAIDMMITDIKNAKMNPDFVKAVTFNNENHNASQSVKNLNIKIRAKLWGDKASNQLNVGEMLTAYDSYATVKNPTEDDIIIHNSEDFIVKAFSKRTAKNTVTVSSKAKGERSFKFEYDVLDVELIDDEGKPIKGHVVEMIADSSKAQFEADLAKLWKEDTQLAIALKGQFANLQYGYAITSHKAQGSTYTNTYVFEDNILGPTNGGDTITKNKSLYVAVSRPTTKLVMISERNGGSETNVTQSEVEKPENTTIKTLPMQPDNIEQIKAGTKTITNRTAKIDNGTYKLPDGTLVEITYVGEAKVTEQGIEINGQVREKDSFAKAEGFKDWNDFKQNNKFSENFINGKQSRFIHKIDTFQSIFQPDKSQSKYSPSLKMYEGFINLNQLYTGEEVLPFIGESEYYRYLVPMLLKMNPKAQNVFTDDMRFVLDNLGTARDMQVVEEMNRIPSGMSAKSLNRNFINIDAKSKTIVHELVHLTLQKEYEKNGEFKQKIDELYGYAWDRQQSDGTYGFSSPKEFLAEALSNPDFMEELNNIQYKEETVWSYLMTLVSDFINNLLNIELRSDSVLAEVVRVSEQVLNNNISEIGKETKVDSTTMANEIYNNWSTYFPDYEWMNDAQRRMTAKLAEEGKITLTCSL